MKTHQNHPKENSPFYIFCSYAYNLALRVTRYKTCKTICVDNLLMSLPFLFSMLLKQTEDFPEGFPFEIEDNPGQRTILLKRKYQDEIIKVEVDMPQTEVGEDEDAGDGGDEEDNVNSSIPLVVSITKGSGLCLEFSVTALPDEICIDSLSIKLPEGSEDQLAYEGPDFK